jgi:GNAT superfamily N-acetyltransferase
MRCDLSTPTPDRLGSLVADLASWQHDGLPVQLHSGDLGWHWRFGSATLAEALRVWTVDGATVAIGFLDEPTLIRMAVAPSADEDAELAEVLVRDLGARQLTVEARFGTALRALLHARGWVAGDRWTSLVRDLTDPVEVGDLRVEVVGPDHVEDRAAVQRAAFERSTFTADLWREMSQTPAYGDARCLVGYDGQDRAVATVTVWSAGPGRQGLLEPMGVHRDHRGHGHGTAICLAAAAALRDLGASSAVVATSSSNAGGVATYVSAGYRRLPDVTDFDYRA